MNASGSVLLLSALVLHQVPCGRAVPPAERSRDRAEAGRRGVCAQEARGRLV